MSFRAPATRATRAFICGVLVLALALAIRDEIVTPNIDAVTRFGWMVPTVVLEIVMVGGLWRLWVVRLIVNERGIVVRNFRGDLHYKRSEIKSVVRTSDFIGFGIALKLKTGDEMRLDGLTWATVRSAEKSVAEISRAIGLVPVDAD